ncbi:hypothetical protein EUX98_g1097 [Antrodiella citrinella]|uniref:Uncharacterized protein n=1 Tax=Antrodiella citrinella TaxID=2447956 RepID=A0A4S4NAW5_9APHY|nr:hypothetical protein EUX98_g1097 [Antrodiella citrinella]
MDDIPEISAVNKSIPQSVDYGSNITQLETDVVELRTLVDEVLRAIREIHGQDRDTPEDEKNERELLPSDSGQYQYLSEELTRHGEQEEDSTFVNGGGDGSDTAASVSAPSSDGSDTAASVSAPSSDGGETTSVFSQQQEDSALQCHAMSFEPQEVILMDCDRLPEDESAPSESQGDLASLSDPVWSEQVGDITDITLRDSNNATAATQLEDDEEKSTKLITQLPDRSRGNSTRMCATPRAELQMTDYATCMFIVPFGDLLTCMT